jgi:ribonuclease-3
MTGFKRVEELIGYGFSDEKLLKKAFTHTSYANEHSADGHRDSNQMLEFLGDSVLGLVVSTYLYENFPAMTEGMLSRFRSRIVCEETLGEVAREFDLGGFILFGHGEASGGGSGKVSVLADCVEALIAAVYLDSDFATVSRIVLDNFGFRQRIELAAGDYSKGDNKSELQEYYRDPSVSISYEIISRSGPDHDPVFEAEIRVEEQGQLLFKERGVGRSKKAAEQAAAGKVLELLRN